MARESEQTSKVLYEGKYLRLKDQASWEYVERTNCGGVVVIAAMTDEKKVLFVEQYRVPQGKNVIEMPAGLVGDVDDQNETLETAARRELLEETGYDAEKFERLIEGPVSSGLTSEQLSFYLASDLTKKSDGGGDDTESIVVHEIPLAEAEEWIFKKQREGLVVDPKVFVGLYFLQGKGC